MNNDQVYFKGATQIILGVLGASVFPYKFSAPSGCIGGQLKILGAAGSTIQVIPNAVSGASVGGATAITTMGGYPLDSGEIFPWYGPANFYLACTGVTGTVAACFEYTAGGATLA